MHPLCIVIHLFSLLQMDSKEEGSSSSKSEAAVPSSAPSDRESSTPLPPQASASATPTAGTPNTAVEELTSDSQAPSSSPPVPDPPQEAEEATQEILMENVPTRNVRANSVPSIAVSGQGYLYNFVLSSAIFLFIALVVRRIFLLEGETPEEFDDILL